MGNISGNKEVINHSPDNLLLGNNEFESATLKLAASGEAKEGYILARNATGEYEVANSTTIVGGTGLAVLVDRDGFKNEGASAATYPTRVCIGGKMKKSLLSVGGTALNEKDVDALRGFGILAVDMADVAERDNQ